jgi:hypothetical protein
MRFARFQTRTKILGAFAIVSFATVLVSCVALWRMAAADATTSALVNNKLARVQLTSELLGLARLNGARAITIARSDSLELSDYFNAQLEQGEKASAAIGARLHALPADAAELTLVDAAAARQAAYVKVRRQVFGLKDLGKTQEAEQMAGTELAAGFDAWAGALDTLLSAQTMRAAGRRRRGGAAARLRDRLAARAQHRFSVAGSGRAGRAGRAGRSERHDRPCARRRDRTPVRRAEPYDGGCVGYGPEGAGFRRVHRRGIR